MRNRSKTTGYVVLLLVIPVLGIFLSFQPVSAQDGRLTLTEVLVELQSKRAGGSLSEINVQLTRRVAERKVTFRLTPEVESELQRAGASQTLINAIRANGPNETTLSRNIGDADNIEFDRLWISYNVTENGQKGMRVHSKFTVRNMKGVPLYLTLRFQKANGDMLESSNQGFRNKAGQLAVFRKLTPGFPNAVYRDYSIFIPYREIFLPGGKHSLKVDADIIYLNGDFLKHLKIHPFVITKTAGDQTTPTNDPRVKFTRMWIDHNVSQGGLRGMRVHTEMTVYNLVNQAVSLAVAVEKADGSKVFAKSQKYRSTNGQLTVYRRLNQRFTASVFKDVTVFIPYGEIDRALGSESLRLHADILYPNKGNLHVTYHDFSLPATSVPRVKFTRMWIDHNVLQGGLRGMRVHTEMTVYNLVNQAVSLAVAVEKADGSKVFAKSQKYRSTNGQLTVYRRLNQRFTASVFKDVTVFIPYGEIDRALVSESLRLHADILYPNKGNLHVTYHRFSLP